ncbi:MAG: monooxygenase, partial [Proteobacteria bacterium]
MTQKTQRVLVSGASFAGLSTAYWMHARGYEVTVVETASALRTGGTAVNLEGNTVDIARRMGILDAIRADRLSLETWEFKNGDDVTERTMVQRQKGEPPPEDAFEVERNTLLRLLFDLVKSDVEFVFDESVVSLRESKSEIE